MATVLALDYGGKRTGIASGDIRFGIASPLTTVLTTEIIPFLKAYIPRHDVDTLVVGQPARLDGSATHSTADTDRFCSKLQTLFPHLKIERIDERFTSKMALRALIDGGASKKRRQDKQLIDQVSAAIILQSYFEAQARFKS